MSAFQSSNCGEWNDVADDNGAATVSVGYGSSGGLNATTVTDDAVTVGYGSGVNATDDDNDDDKGTNTRQTNIIL